MVQTRQNHTLHRLLRGFVHKMLRCTIRAAIRPLKGNFQALNTAQIRYRTNFSRQDRQKRKSAQSTRENDWIRGGDFIEVDPTHYNKLKCLSDIKDSSNIYRKDQKLQNDIDIALYLLNKNAISGALKYQKYNEVFENYSYEYLIKTALRTFEDKLHHSLQKFTLSDSVKLEHVLVPSIDDLPNLVKNISDPLIQDYFKSLDIQSSEEQIYYFFEQTLHTEYRLLKTNRTPPQSIKVDITNPAEWFPKARKVKRKIIMHVGPTNSGKTYNALKRLRESNNGYFAGPLRLLAREIYDRFKAEGVRCNLVTGEEVIEDLDQFGNKAPLSSGTVEMIDLNAYYDVVVLDEIQMMGDESRGWAWTSALLGAQAKEIHLCGEERSVPLIKEILKSTGDELIINKYERLGKLVVNDKPLYNKLDDLKKGDCIVVFSKKRILTYKIEIERSTRLKCGVIYGALPAEVRSTEASKFNNGEYDILIASDAIGMGLNLKINRVIFDDHKKFDGATMSDIHPAHVKQVGGRAGRFKVAPNRREIHQNVSKDEKLVEDLEVDLNDDKDTSIGYVTAFHSETLDYIKKCFSETVADLDKAVIWPEGEIWSHYISEYPKDTRFSDIMKAFKNEVEETSGIYEAASIRDRVTNVAIFDNVRNMLVSDQLRISDIPLNNRIDEFPDVMMDFGLQVTSSQTKNALDFNNMNYYKHLSGSSSPTTTELNNLETLHKKLMAWLWMNNRYPTLFVDRESAEDLKILVEYKIEEALESLKVDNIERRGKGKYRGAKKPNGKSFRRR